MLTDARNLGFSLVADEARDIAEMGVKITAAANEQLGFSHPTNTDWNHISFCQMTAPIEVQHGVKVGRNAVTIQPGKLDRSPCGTGCSARMAVLHARGELLVGEPFMGVSIIDSEFHCRIKNTAQIGGVQGIVPILSGRAWLTGTRQLMLDPADPWPGGYKLPCTC